MAATLFYTFLPLFVFFLNSASLVFVWAQQRRTDLNRSFLILSGLISAWLFLDFFTRLPFIHNLAPLLVLKIGALFWIPVAFAYLNLVYAFLRRKRDAIYWILSVSTSICMIVSSSGNLVIFGAQEYYEGVRIFRGILFLPIVVISAVVPVAVSQILLLIHLRRKPDSLRKRIMRLLLAGSFLTLLISVLAEFVLPHYFNIEWFLANSSSIAIIQNSVLLFAAIRYKFLSVDFENLAELLFINMRDGVIIVDNNNRIIDINPMAEMLLKPDVGLYGQRVDEVVPELAGKESKQSFDFFSEKAGGKYFSVSQWAIEFLKNRKFRFIMVRDITARKKLEDDLSHNAFHDELTGLPNRALFIDRLEIALKKIRRDREKGFAVFFMDLDRFKLINDSMGHLAGDQLLKVIAERISRCIRPGDMVARLGGDEFTVLLEGMNLPVAAVRIARRIQKELRTPVEIMGQELQVSTSIGIVFGHDEYENPDDILRDADLALYRSKTAGRNRYTIFSGELQSEARHTLSMEAHLRRAMLHNHLGLHYQPVYSLKKRKFVGFEAFLRWDHPDGEKKAGEFLNIAEDAGMMQIIGPAVFEGADKFLKKHRDQSFFININVSPAFFLSRSFINNLKHVMRNSEWPASRLCIDISEQSIVRDFELSHETMLKLHSLGIGMFWDNFGRNYSSLNFLRQLPFDMIKIDGSLINEIEHDGRSAAIVESVIEMVHHLDMSVVAQKVETSGQMRLLEKMGCDLIQGYALGRELNEEAALAFDFGKNILTQAPIPESL